MAHEGMVHALKECHRVLRDGGPLVDARPIGIDRDIEIIAGAERFHAGIVDVSRGRPDDVAADAAIREVVREGLFVLESSQTFSFTNYWETLAGAREHVEDVWADFATVDEDTWTRAADFIEGCEDVAVQIAVRGPIRMDCYRGR